MKIEVKIPAMGESVSEARIGRWLKSDGAAVSMDEPILELETDKANMEIAAGSAGVLKISRKDGEMVRAGDVVGAIDTDEAAEKSQAVESAPKSKEEKPKTAEKPKVEEVREPQADPPEPPSGQSAASPEKEGSERTSPSARRLAREHGVEAAAISGSGRGGRVGKEDVQQFIQSRREAPTEGPPAEAGATSPIEGPAAKAGDTPAAKASTAPDTGERERRVPMSLIRRKIAERLVQAQQTAAILTTFNEVDMSSILEVRSRYRESFEKRHGVSLGFMSFFVKASIEALKFVPELNASVDGSDILYKNYYDISVAVSTDRGLVVPVVRGADRMTFAEIEKALADYAGRARAGKISVDELTGGTFTISNGGVFGSLLSTPILNPPQTGILGMHKIEKRPVVVDDAVVVRPMMYLALSYDHRLVDGKEAVTFLVRIKECLEDPRRLLLAV
ncbi:MAG: 2-oxoglutarate dehydrogenase complex dihydrolipoyllysine-residue succinyltransferase [Acidobacteriota bacterium]